jgi:uncharacterized protein (TIGR03382 family)
MLPAVASASSVWKGDFEPGNLSQWSGSQQVNSSRLSVVTSPVREGRYALKTTVRQGDRPIKASGNRNELFYLSREANNSEYSYKWSTLFPKSFPRSSKWQVFAQWHHEGCCGSPPLEFYIVSDELRMRVGGTNGKVLWKAPLQRDKWNDFVLRVKWSHDPNTGFVELYHNGKLVVSRTKVATQYKGERNYLKLGLYRDASISAEGVVFHDGFTMATRLEDVMSSGKALIAEDSPPSTEQTPVDVADLPAAEAGPAPELADADITPVEDVGPIVEPPDDATDIALSEQVVLDEQGQAASGCGASATGGAPLLAAIGLLAMFALMGRRRQQALARAQAPRTPARRGR